MPRKRISHPQQLSSKGCSTPDIIDTNRASFINERVLQIHLMYEPYEVKGPPSLANSFKVYNVHFSREFKVKEVGHVCVVPPVSFVQVRPHRR